MNALPSPGDSRTLSFEELTRTAIVQYAGASGDFSPIHIDEPAAVAEGHSSVMGHGMLTMAQGARVLTDWFGAESIMDLQARFTAPVWPGDRLTVRATVTAVADPDSGTTADIELNMSRGDGNVVLTGTATVSLEPGSEQAR